MLSIFALIIKIESDLNQLVCEIYLKKKRAIQVSFLEGKIMQKKFFSAMLIIVLFSTVHVSYASVDRSTSGTSEGGSSYTLRIKLQDMDNTTAQPGVSLDITITLSVTYGSSIRGLKSDSISLSISKDGAPYDSNSGSGSDCSFGRTSGSCNSLDLTTDSLAEGTYVISGSATFKEDKAFATDPTTYTNDVSLTVDVVAPVTTSSQNTVSSGGDTNAPAASGFSIVPSPFNFLMSFLSLIMIIHITRRKQHRMN